MEELTNKNPLGGYLEYELLNKKETIIGNPFLFNSGRSAFAYILKYHSIDSIQIPYYTCDVIIEPLEKLNIDYSFYNINQELVPDLSSKNINPERPILVNNYFGLMDSKISDLKLKDSIVDNSQAIYSDLNGTFGSFNSFRKFIGLTDGAEAVISGSLPSEVKKSALNFRPYFASPHFEYLIGRIEKGAEYYYEDFKKGDDSLKFENIELISKISARTYALVNHDEIKKIRRRNFNYLSGRLNFKNEFNWDLLIDQTPMVYPFLIENGLEIRKELIKNKVFIPTYWPNKLIKQHKNSFEEYLTKNLIALPIDQRYGKDDMITIVNLLKKFMR